MADCPMCGRNCGDTCYQPPKHAVSAEAQKKSNWEWVDKHSDVRVGDEYADINFFRNTETGEIRAEVDL